jgi:hypothetical protein
MDIITETVAAARGRGNFGHPLIPWWMCLEGMVLLLFGMQYRTHGPYLAAADAMACMSVSKA